MVTEALLEKRIASEDERWILSFYRVSEIGGALLFGRLASCLKPGPIQRDMTRHFSDEACHAWFWTECLERMGTSPLKVEGRYQDRYLDAAGVPANVMEVLALTQAFERRVIGQYALHAQVPGLRPEIASTLGRIMEDERWHLAWIRGALARLDGEYGADRVAEARRRYVEADRHVYRQVLLEHEGRLGAVPRVGAPR
jgi:hypothetical protein